MARRGSFNKSITGWAWLGMSRLGWARQGSARQGDFEKRNHMKFEIDIDVLIKGSVISVAECERVLKLRRDDDVAGYQFGLMQLCDFVQRSLWKVGREWTLKTSQGEILVLTDEQASEYNASQFENGMAKMRRSNKRLRSVDIRNIDESKRNEHDERVSKQGVILQCIKSSRRGKIHLAPVERSTPVKAELEATS